MKNESEVLVISLDDQNSRVYGIRQEFHEKEYRDGREVPDNNYACIEVMCPVGDSEPNVKIHQIFPQNKNCYLE